MAIDHRTPFQKWYDEHPKPWNSLGQYDDSYRAWEACKAAMLEKINDEDFLLSSIDVDLSRPDAVHWIAVEMRKLVDEL